MQNVQVLLRRVPSGTCTPDDFELIEAPAPRAAAGEMLCRARWLALEGRALSGANARPGLVAARAIVEVVESRNDVYAVGACVELEHGLQLLSVCDGARVHALHPAQTPPSTALGILGWPGMTAYFAVTDLAGVQARETVLVCDAAGAGGSMAGQIAALRGARAIGIVDARDKGDWVTRTARCAACIDLTSGDLHRRLRALAPNGVDVYYEDRAGESLLHALIEGAHFARDARIVIRGVQASDTVMTAAGAARVIGLDPARHAQRREQFLREALPRYGDGLIVYREDIVEGLREAPRLACRIVRGETFGQPLVRV